MKRIRSDCTLQLATFVSQWYVLLAIGGRSDSPSGEAPASSVNYCGMTQNKLIRPNTGRLFGRIVVILLRIKECSTSAYNTAVLSFSILANEYLAI